MGIQIQEMPVSSAIMSPWQKEVVVHNGEIEVEGKCHQPPAKSLDANMNRLGLFRRRPLARASRSLIGRW